ncbi:MAG: hypothetical protein R2873_10065 [Caldilineaceae bacterium]
MPTAPRLLKRRLDRGWRRCIVRSSYPNLSGDAFLVCLAPMIELRFERLFGYLQDDIIVRRPTVSTLLDLLADTEEALFRRCRRSSSRESSFAYSGCCHAPPSRGCDRGCSTSS